MEYVFVLNYSWRVHSQKTINHSFKKGLVPRMPVRPPPSSCSYFRKWLWKFSGKNPINLTSPRPHLTRQSKETATKVSASMDNIFIPTPLSEHIYKNKTTRKRDEANVLKSERIDPTGKDRKCASFQSRHLSAKNSYFTWKKLCLSACSWSKPFFMASRSLNFIQTQVFTNGQKFSTPTKGLPSLLKSNI